MREDQLDVLAAVGSAALRAPAAVMAEGVEAEADKRVGVVRGDWTLGSGATAGLACVELADPCFLPGEQVVGRTVGLGDAEVEGTDQRVPREVHAKGLLVVPPRAGLDVRGIDINCVCLLVILAFAVVAVVRDACVVAPVAGGHPHWTQDVV